MLGKNLVPSQLDPAMALWRETIPATRPWSGIVKKDQTFRIVDTEGQQAVDTLFYSADNPAERYSAQDTITMQGSPYLTTGTRLISNEARVMAEVVADTVGNHDTCAGACSVESNRVRFGHHTRYMHACRENFIIALAEHGLTKRDIVSNINFFMNVPISPDGAVTIVDGLEGKGNYIELRAEMNLICAISNCPQINNPCNAFVPTPIEVLVWGDAA